MIKIFLFAFISIGGFTLPLISTATPNFIGKPKTSSKKNSSQCNDSLVKTVESIIPIKEIVQIRDGYTQYPTKNLFGLDYVTEYSYVQDSLGDQLRVFVYPDASPFSSANRFNKDNNSFSHNGTPLPGSKVISQKNFFQNDDLDENPVSSLNDEMAVREYVLKFYEDRELSESSIEMIANIILKDPELLKKAKSANIAIKNSRRLELTNFDLNRYFWFQPEGRSNYYPARVIDIHRNNNPYGFVFLIEYVSESSAEKIRVRVVQQLRLSEFQTMQENIGQENRQSAKQAFFETLSPEEIQTVKLAELMKLKLFGYFDFRRSPGVNTDSATALETMNNLSYLAISAHIEGLFGRLEDLMTSFELEQTYPNYLDIFGRLNPRYVMQRFATSQTLDTEFYWIITEDGQLKVIPAMAFGNNLKPQILRLSSGRKIFAGGTFFLRNDNSLDVRLNASGYQINDIGWGAGYAFQQNNINLNEFVSIVFGLQLGRNVNELTTEELEYWYSYDEPSKQNQYGRDSNHDKKFDKDFNFEDFVSNMKTQAQKATVKPPEQITWDLEKGKPMNLELFAKYSGFPESDNSTKRDWAHYVLRTNSRMAWQDIKMSYRILSSKFHPDRNPSPNSTEIMQNISQAYQFLEKDLKIQD